MRVQQEGDETKKLYIITHMYPYGFGEKSFIEPELKILLESNRFDITIICNAPVAAVQTSEVDSRIKIVRIPKINLFSRPFFTFGKIINYFWDKQNQEERIAVAASLKKWDAYYESIMYYVQAKLFEDELNRLGLNFNNAYVYTYWFYVQTLAVIYRKNNGEECKLISRIHGFDLYKERMKGGRQPFRKMMDQYIDKLFFIAETGRRYYIKNYDVSNPNKYELCRLGTFGVEDISKYTHRKNTEGPFLLVSCSNIIELKQINLIIEALYTIENYKIKWIHFGDGTERQRIEELAHTLLDCKKNISYEFKGNVSNQDIHRFYQNNYVDCFITTSRTEGCPVSIQEAMSYGIPIIATDVGEIPLMINGNGYLLSNFPSVDEISAAIESVINMSAEDKKRAQEKSRLLWEEYFNAEENHKKFNEKILEM